MVSDPHTEAHPRHRSGLRTESVEGEIVILDIDRAMAHCLNPTASFIWHLCDGEHSVADIVDQLLEVFETDSIQAQEDVRAILQEFKDLCFLD